MLALPEDARRDVVGIGMVNVDYVFEGRQRGDGSGLVDVGSGRSRRIDSPDELTDLLAFVRQQDFQTSVGGSALNTICALAEMRLGLRLGFVGVEGMMPRQSDLDANRPALRVLSAAGVGCEHLYYYADEMAGICLCEDAEQGRRLRTWTGANARIASVLASNARRSIVRYLERAKIVHVSPFLNPHAAASIIHLLEELKRRTSALRITLDPGYSWAQSPPRDFSKLLRLADIIFVNQQEFVELGGSGPGLGDIAIARQILGRCSPDAVLVLKTNQGATMFRGSSCSPVRHSVLGEAATVKIDVGAGDVFAAGFLAGQLSAAGPTLLLSAQLAHRVALEHLRYGKSSWSERLPAVAANFIGR